MCWGSPKEATDSEQIKKQGRQLAGNTCLSQHLPDLIIRARDTGGMSFRGRRVLPKSETKKKAPHADRTEAQGAHFSNSSEAGVDAIKKGIWEYYIPSTF